MSDKLQAKDLIYEERGIQGVEQDPARLRRVQPVDDQEFIAACCDHVLHMQGGGIVA